MRSKLSLAICQLTSVDDVDCNLKQIENLLLEIAPGQVDLICLPENSLYMRVQEGEKIPGFTLTDPVFEHIARIAKKLKTNIHLGSVPLKEGEKMSNTSVLVREDGSFSVDYKKIHLFDIELEGQKKIRESDVFLHGSAPHILNVKDWKIGQTICYDLRFSELFHEYALAQVDLILVPSAFLVQTGQAHWEVLLRARAIESQAYVVAAAQAGEHKGKNASSRHTYGHSLVVDPWGKVLAQGVSDQPQLLQIDLEKTEIQRVRRQIPMHQHRRLKKSK